jgi:hypothetical protein
MRRTAITLVLLAAFSSSLSVSAEPAQMNKLASEIVLRNIDLQELVQRYHLAAAMQSYDRSKREWLWDIGNGVATESGLIGATALFFSHCNDQTVSSTKVEKTENGLSVLEIKEKVRNHVPADKVAATIIPQICGQAFGGCGALYEFGADLSWSKKIRNQRFDRKAVTLQIVERVKGILALQAEYDARASTESNSRFYAAESRVLKVLTAKSIAEFLRLEKRSTQIRSAQYIEDGISVTRNAIGALGNSLNVAANYRTNLRLNGQGSILNLIAASMITTRPFITNIGSLLVSRRSRGTKLLIDKSMRNDKFDYVSSSTETFATDLNLLHQEFEGISDEQIQKRIRLYDAENSELAEQEALAQVEERRSRQIIARRFRETVYGPTKVVQSSLVIDIGFRKQKNSTADNRLAAAGNLTYCSGQLLNILELVRERVIDSQSHSRDAALNMLPEQRVAKSLETIKALPAQILQ